MMDEVVAYHRGLALLAALLVPAGLTGLRLSRGFAGPERALAASVAALSQLTFASLAAGIAGWLTLPVLLALNAALSVAVYLSSGQVEATGEVGDRAPCPSRAWLAGLAGAPLALSAVRGTIAPPMNWDSLAYHLPFVARMLETGSLAGYLALPAYPVQVTYFPQGGELPWFWAIAPWRADFAAGLLNHLFVVLTALAVYVLSRRLGAGALPAALAAALFALLPMHYASVLGTANVDLYFTFALGAAACFLVRAPAAEGFAAAACGLMLGVKLTALACLPLLALLALAAGWRPTARTAASAALALALGGWWYARNALATGNPVYPLLTGTLGAAERFVDGPLDRAAFRALADAVWGQLGPYAALAVIAWAVHAAVAAHGLVRGAPDRGLHAAWVASAAALGVSWFWLPSTANWIPYNLRYLLPALVLAAPSVAVAAGALGVAGSALEAAGAALAALLLAQCAPFLGLPATWSLAGIASASLLALVSGRRLFADARARLVLAVAVLDLVGWGLYHLHGRPDLRFDQALAGYHGGAMREMARFADAHPGAAFRIAGGLPSYYLYGSRFENRVTYLEGDAPPDYLVITRSAPDAPWPAEPAGSRPLLAGDCVKIFAVAR